MDFKDLIIVIDYFWESNFPLNLQTYFPHYLQNRNLQTFLNMSSQGFPETFGSLMKQITWDGQSKENKAIKKVKSFDLFPRVDSSCSWRRIWIFFILEF